jgi:hypothetical protein
MCTIQNKNYHCIVLVFIYERTVTCYMSGGDAPLKIGKNIIFWRKIVIFHTKYPNIFRASLRSAPFF